MLVGFIIGIIVVCTLFFWGMLIGIDLAETPEQKRLEDNAQIQYLKEYRTKKELRKKRK